MTAFTYAEIEARLKKVQEEITVAVRADNKVALCAIVERLTELLTALAQWYLRQGPGNTTDFHLEGLKTYIGILQWEAVVAAEAIHPTNISS